MKDSMKVDSSHQLNNSIPLGEYATSITKTDRFSNDEIAPILLGLFGEVGSIMAAAKKYRREKKAYPGFQQAAEEEFGDALWYLAALCRRLDLAIEDLFELAIKDDAIYEKVISASNRENSPVSQLFAVKQIEDLDMALIELGRATAQLLKNGKDVRPTKDELAVFVQRYLQALQSTGVTFSRVVKGNLDKALGRFSSPDRASLPDFDAQFQEEEQLPRQFEIHITQRNSGQCYLRWNGVFIGAPLTDNIRDRDGFRFHDVFHLAHAAILHWSPTFRALIKHKRKSDPVFDETQDGGRAIVVEEGLTAWLFSYAKGLDFFEGHDSVSFDVLKTIQKFVQGYEVDECPLKLWEDAILQGYAVFRQVRANNGGVVIGDRERRTLSYRSIGERQ
jgi:NTP pyrophosphatase (non-canonical NTP hydrolase)